MGEKVSSAPPADGCGESLRRLPIKKGGYANFALISRLRAAASPEGEAFKE